MSIYRLLSSDFSGGEMKPEFQGRVETELYQRSLEMCRNAIPDQLGYVFKRPGTKYLTMLPERASRILPTPFTTEGDYKIGYTVFTPGTNNVSVSFLPKTGTAWVDSSPSAITIHEMPLDALFVDNAIYLLFKTKNGGVYEKRIVYRQNDTVDGDYLAVEALTGLSPSSNETLSDISYLYPLCQTIVSGRRAVVCKTDVEIEDADPSFTSFAENYAVLLSRPGDYDNFELYNKVLIPVTPDVYGYYKSSNDTFYEMYYPRTGTYNNEIEPENGKIYQDRRTQVNYRYDFAGGDGYYTELEPEYSHEVLSNCAILLNIPGMVDPAWIHANERLYIGAGNGIWASDGSAPTPESFYMDKVVGSGVGQAKPVSYIGRMIFTDSTNRDLMTLAYNKYYGRYETEDLSIAGNVISDITAIVLQEAASSMLWLQAADNRLLSCTLSSQGGLSGWAIHDLGTGYSIKDLISSPYDNTVLLNIDRDEFIQYEYDAGSEAWNITHGNTLEQLTPQSLVHDYADISKTFFLDGWQKYTATPATDSFTVERFAGKTVWAVTPNGKVFKNIEIDDQDGEHPCVLTLPEAVTSIIVGYPYTMMLRTPQRVLPANGSSYKTIKSLDQLAIKVLTSQGGKIGKSAVSMVELGPFLLGNTQYGVVPPLVTGDRDVKLPAFADEETRLYIISDEPKPFKLLGLIQRYGLGEA